jgi:hypothetical chaperone protein
VTRYIGLDFGTTNTSLAWCDDGAAPRLARFGAEESETFRSVLFFDPNTVGPGGGARAWAGPEAITRYLASDGGGRLVQSLKSYLASTLFQRTQVFSRTYSLEELIAVILRGVRTQAEAVLGPAQEPVRGVVVGRPVRFVHAKTDDDEALAQRRLTEALRLAGFDDVRFEYEPVGAAHWYESGLDHDELVLIGDFGGGTSDFCLMRVGPGQRDRAGKARIVGTEGVGLAGDAFDGEIVDHAVSPVLGKGGHFSSYLDGKSIAVPPWIYQHLRRWHHLSFLRSRETQRFLHDIKAQSPEPERFEALLHLVEADLGFHLHKRVEGAKVALSGADACALDFEDGPLAVHATLARPDFEAWIAEHLAAIARAVDALLAQTGVTAREVDRVFLTGGSSLVPAVRRQFAARFGEDKLRGGAALTSVALGLAVRAREGA